MTTKKTDVKMAKADTFEQLSVPRYKVSMTIDAHSVWQKSYEATGPEGIVKMLMPFIKDLDRENFYVVMLDSQSEVIGMNLVAIGGVDRVAASPAEIFRPAILAGASGVVLLHNHPSYNHEPSPQDVEATFVEMKLGNYLNISVLDSVVVSKDGKFTSIIGSGLMEDFIESQKVAKTPYDDFMNMMAIISKQGGIR